MPSTYVLARDHLQRAVTILQGEDNQSRQIRYIIERTINLIEDIQNDPRVKPSNVFDLAAFRHRRANAE